MKSKLLVVDDEKNTREALRKAFEGSFEVYLGYSVESAKNIFQTERMDLVLTDLRLGNESGLEVLKLCQSQVPPTPCVVMTAYGSVESAVEAMRRGAYDYVTKPLDLDRAEMLLQRAVRTVRVEQENQSLRAQLDRSFGLDRILGHSEAIEKVLDRVRQVADSKASVLIEGESGTGKELVARAIHGLSTRRSGPFVAVHCAALSPQLLESELFGHEKGSFTGATERRVGRFEQANGGTIFLDEIGEIDLATQVKLLRVLGERSLERVGGNQLLEVDVRLIVATHRSLEKLVREGKFREDLYFRIRVVQIDLPPLRDRLEDIPILAEAFRREYGQENGKAGVSFSSASMECLLRYHWPGNIRELRTAVEHGVVLAKGVVIEPEDLPSAVRNGRADIVSGKEGGISSLDEVKSTAMQEAYKKSGKNVSAAARELGISRRTLQRKLAVLENKGKVKK
jgi:two-component system, NtrC family, response regulator AtoC